MSFQQNFLPYSNTITSITNANPGVVTTATAHGYNNGLYVRITWTGNFGMQQVLNNVYLITVLSPTTFSINADTTNYDPFVISTTKQVPQVIPVSEVASTLISAEINAKNIIPEIGWPLVE